MFSIIWVFLSSSSKIIVDKPLFKRSNSIILKYPVPEPVSNHFASLLEKTSGLNKLNMFFMREKGEYISP